MKSQKKLFGFILSIFIITAIVGIYENRNVDAVTSPCENIPKKEYTIKSFKTTSFDISKRSRAPVGGQIDQAQKTVKDACNADIKSQNKAAFLNCNSGAPCTMDEEQNPKACKAVYENPLDMECNPKQSSFNPPIPDPQNHPDYFEIKDYVTQWHYVFKSHFDGRTSCSCIDKNAVPPDGDGTFFDANMFV